ncbi:MAG: 16S rRNA processing protein RimM [Ruminococcaceae bacterium]|nr:16S rRNA processing protein RimM [Oscillospiraceae bacterium]
MPQKPYLEAGQIVGTHGVRGEVRVQPWCDSPEQFAGFKKLYWDDAGKQPVKIKGRPHKNIALVVLENVTTVEQAQVLRGKMLYVDRKDLKLPRDRYLVQDLIGLTVVDVDTDQVYGTLTDVSQTGANAVYHMKTPKGEVLIPAIPDVVVKIDLKKDILYLRPMKGLLDDDEI